MVCPAAHAAYTYLVESFLARDQTSLRNQVPSRYPDFYRKLQSSPRKEVRMLVSMVSSDPRSTTCKNLRYLREKTGMEQPQCFSLWKINSTLPVQKVPADQMWRLGLMTKLMEMNQKKYMEVKDSQRITAMLDSLCST
jgi:hypothetical protein